MVGSGIEHSELSKSNKSSLCVGHLAAFEVIDTQKCEWLPNQNIYLCRVGIFKMGVICKRATQRETQSATCKTINLTYNCSGYNEITL
jgi:hypothetical protein